MPIYEYCCRACGHDFEEIQSLSAPPIKKCPECGKSAVEKLVSATRFQLKGTGWYETDFKTKPAPAKESSEKSATDKKVEKVKKNDAD